MPANTPVYRHLRPRATLGDIVESIWVQDDPLPNGHPPSCVVPTGTVEMLFHYGDPFVHVEDSGPQLLPRSYVTGQRTRPVFAAPTGSVGIVIVSLFPWALGCLFNGRTELLTDAYVDLRDLVGASIVERLECRLVDANERQRIGLVEEFVAALCRDGAADLRIRAGVGGLMAGAGEHGVASVARRLGWSERHFRRLFRSQVGIGPKAFQKVMRFQRALESRRSGAAWPAIAAACGYTDQAHMIREMRAFSGKTPTEVDRRRDQDDEVFNGGDVSILFNTVYL